MYKLFSYILFGLLIFLYSCNPKTYFTIFEIDKKNGIFIPKSYYSKELSYDVSFLVRKVMNVRVDKVILNDKKIDIYLDSIPDINYEFDSFLTYYSLYLSIFTSFSADEVHFLYKDKVLVLAGLQYVMNYKDFYKYPVNDFFNIGNSSKGKYFLFRYEGYVVPFLLPQESDWDFYFNKSLEIFKNKGINLETISEDKNIILINYDSKSLTFNSKNNIYFFSLYLDKSSIYWLFYNSDVEYIKVRRKILIFDLSVKIHRPKDLYLNRYPLNLK